MGPIIPDTLTLPEKTLFGPGRLAALLAECSRFGSRGLIVYGQAIVSAAAASARAPEALFGPTAPALSVLTVQHTGGEPTLAQVADALALARRHRAEWVAGVGGGSVLDLAKAVAGLFHAARAPVDYHDGAPLERPGVPFIAVPATAGTGAEATLNTVLTNGVTGSKKSIRHESFMARVVILDPDLLATCPPPVMAASGMDAFTQAVEAFASVKASWLSDQLALEGLTLIAANLEAVHAGARAGRLPAPAAAHLLLGSCFTGVALSFARLGVVHGIAHPLGSLYHVPHGLVCAVCLPYALELNRPALGGKYDAMSGAIGGDLLAEARRLVRQLGLSSPFAGRPLPQREDIIRETLASGSTACNPKPVTRTDVEWLLERLFAPA
jgi:alcohol dehydrogenase class IV